MNAKEGSVSKVAIATIIICYATAILSYCGEPGLRLPTRSTPDSPTYSAAKFRTTAPYPDKLRIALVSDQLNTLDFMTLGGCALQITLGKYNSKLGRGASDSQRLLLDLEYLRLAPQCVDHKHGSGEPELAAFLETVRQLKQQQLPTAIFNATLANTEFHRFWRNPAVSDNPAGQQQLTLSALQAINTLSRQWLSGDHRASNIEFEIHLSEIARGSIMPADRHDRKVLQSIVQLEQLLDAALPPTYRVWQQERDH
jgi:hypothetical protein